MPRAGLTPATVVDEAARLADEVGLDRLTLAQVASRLGVSLPSLYKHVPGLDGLRRLLALRGIRELTAATTTAAVGRSGPAALRAVAVAYRDYARAHPGPYAASLRAPDPGDAEYQAAAEGAVAVFLAVLDGYGLSGDRAIDATRVARSALHGFVAIDAAAGFGLPLSLDSSFEQLVAALDRALTSWPR
ncbi:TetR/AcrR family transcriptional regulator [Asanoa siamensis]|uniref:TetR family transcriptional regulator n=1 Tax=Asanoa siamensis TaxID=926357 RepID=A0ABQ4CRR6_9ACTN|nr:TetR/AcrR family transcriptional regulator [Asanoa siamensis]GIF73982.1 TetR family transcriptional regulator [Asanoa siamensis]